VFTPQVLQALRPGAAPAVNLFITCNKPFQSSTRQDKTPTLQHVHLTHHSSQLPNHNVLPHAISKSSPPFSLFSQHQGVNFLYILGFLVIASAYWIYCAAEAFLVVNTNTHVSTTVAQVSNFFSFLLFDFSAWARACCISLHFICSLYRFGHSHAFLDLV